MIAPSAVMMALSSCPWLNTGVSLSLASMMRKRKRERRRKRQLHEWSPQPSDCHTKYVVDAFWNFRKGCDFWSLAFSEWALYVAMLTPSFSWTMSLKSKFSFDRQSISHFFKTSLKSLSHRYTCIHFHKHCFLFSHCCFWTDIGYSLGSNWSGIVLHWPLSPCLGCVEADLQLFSLELQGATPQQ